MYDCIETNRFARNALNASGLTLVICLCNKLD